MKILGRPLVIALALGFVSPAARAQNPPPRPAQAQAPALLTPPRPVPPPAPAAAAPRAVSGTPTAAPLRPPARAGAPPDSVRPAGAPAAAVAPADATAQCGDGTFITTPGTGGCTTHGGVRIVLPRRVAPAPVAAHVAPATVAQPSSRAAEPPPAGATMRCKDGTYLAGSPSESACSGRGGLAAILSAPRTAPPPPSRARRP